MIVLACIGAGLYEVRRLSENVQLWRDWVRLLTQLHAKLRYTARPVQEIFASCDADEYPSLRWLSEFDTPSKGMFCPQAICAEETAFAKSFFAFIGTSDLEGQLTHIAQYTEQAKECFTKETERRQRLSKVYLSTAVCVGLSVGIVIL